MFSIPRKSTATIGATLTLCLSLAACGAPAGENNAAESEGWEPEQVVTLTVPFSAGGGTDTMARTIAEGLEEVRPGLKIQVVNREGAGGAVGYSHTFAQSGNPHELVAVESSIITAPYVNETGWEYTDFTPIGQVSAHTAGLAVPAGKYTDLNDFLETVEAGGSLSVGLAGAADSFFDIVISALAEKIDNPGKFRRVSYEDGNKTALSVVSGDSDAVVMSPEHVTEFMRAGDVDTLAVFTDSRIEQGVLADVPTAQEQGLDFSLQGVRGISAAPDLTEEQTRYWRAAFLEWTKHESYQKYIESSQSLAVPKGRKGYMANLDTFAEAAKRYLG
ncbi:MAG: hypothetical protein GEU78_14515 [Actinobacteria bacterium]|nr:hypothetical protein [Actinomycetota bacterium]